MTSEAKIGLLLGLVVIFIIAFVVNGLPGFKKGEQPQADELMARPQQNPPGIGAAQRDVINQGNLPPTNPQGGDVRTTVPLGPGAGSGTGTNQPPTVIQTNTPPNVTAQPPVNTGIPPVTTPPVQTAAAKTYTVQSGDSLASIAIKFYGSKEGNRKVNIDKIFAANKKILRSADEIYEGQKLVIPPLEGTSASSSGSTTTTTSSSTTGSGRTTSGTLSSSGTREYVVADGDSLWKIAASKLGDGSRYDEIVALNNLKNEDSITVGMRLKLPAK